jgi:protein-S-isoprenylcysteine O-methyltransferase Ste14
VKATGWEFANRGLVIGLIFTFAFPLYAWDPQNSASGLASWLGPKLHVDPNVFARLIFVFAALLLVAAALIRTWASSYLHARVVYAEEVKSASLVADGPYRHVRNPLYFANVVMAIGMGALMSRAGFIVALLAMPMFCYRLILREEGELEVKQAERVRTLPQSGASSVAVSEPSHCGSRR